MKATCKVHAALPYVCQRMGIQPTLHSMYADVMCCWSRCVQVKRRQKPCVKGTARATVAASDVGSVASVGIAGCTGRILFHGLSC